MIPAFFAAFLLLFPSDPSQLTIPVAHAAGWTQDQLQDYATKKAQSSGLNVGHFLDVIQCESGWDASTQSGWPDPTGPNGKEDSWGLVQINLPRNKSVTKDEALDPVFSIDFMARLWEADQASKWSCWNLYEKQGFPSDVLER